MTSSVYLRSLVLLCLFEGLTVRVGVAQEAVVRPVDASKAFFTAEKLLLEGHPLLAARHWDKVRRSSASTSIIADISKSRLGSISNLNHTYSASLEYQPVARRTYGADIFYVSLGGQALPFQITRKEHVFDVLTLSQSLSFPAVAASSLSLFDFLEFNHTLVARSDDSAENKISGKLYIRNFTDRILTFWEKSFTFNSHSQSVFSADKLAAKHVATPMITGIELTYSRPINERKTVKDLNQSLQVGVNTSYSGEVGTLGLTYDRFIFSQREKNYRTAAFKYTHSIPKFYSSVSISVEVRDDDESRFPFDTKRFDTLYKLSSVTKLSHLKGLDVLHLHFSQNRSNIGVYDYNEFGASLSFEF